MVLMGEPNNDWRGNFPQDWVVSDTGQVNQRAVRAAPHHSQQEACEASPKMRDTRGGLPRAAFLTFLFYLFILLTRRSLVLSKCFKPNERREIRRGRRGKGGSVSACVHKRGV